MEPFAEVSRESLTRRKPQSKVLRNHVKLATNLPRWSPNGHTEHSARIGIFAFLTKTCQAETWWNIGFGSGSVDNGMEPQGARCEEFLK